MIGVADSATNEGLGVELHRPPSPAAGQRVSGDERCTFGVRQAFRELAADVYGCLALPKQKFTVVRLFATAAQWLVPQDKS